MMPLFRGSRTSGREEGCAGGGRQKKTRRKVCVEDAGSVSSLSRLCLLNVAHNMDTLWAKDYADNYLDKVWFRHIMGPFNALPGHLVEELTEVLTSRKQLSRAGLHLLLVPQLHSLSLAGCPGMVTPGVCSLIAARCQVLSSLDLSGAHQLPAQAQCAMLSCLPSLRCLLLAGTPCDRRVIWTLARRCRELRHLDVSRCHLLSPAALLPLGGGVSPSSCGSSACPASTSQQASSCPPLPLLSLQALDLGFGDGEEEGDAVAAAAYLLLALPGLQRAALGGLARACCLIQSREFGPADGGLPAREKLPGLEEMWRERRRREGAGREGTEEEEEEEEEGDERPSSWGAVSEGEGEEAGGDEAPRPRCFRSLEEKGSDDERNTGREEERQEAGETLREEEKEESLTLHLREIQGVSFSSLEAVGRLCPHVCSLTLDHQDPQDPEGPQAGSMLAQGLRHWGSGQLRSLTVRYPHSLSDLLPSLHCVTSHLASLTLEGVKAGPQTPLLGLLGACPRLRELSISIEPRPFQMEEEEGEELQEPMREEEDLPRLPHLCSLSLHFSYEHSVMKPVMYWRSLQRVIKCLLSGSPLLEKVSLVSLPCPLNTVLRQVLLSPPPSGGPLRHHMVGEGGSSDPPSGAPPQPLGRLQRLCASRTDLTPDVVRSLLDGCRRLRHLDLTCCWNIHQASAAGFHRETLTVLWR